MKIKWIRGVFISALFGVFLGAIFLFIGIIHNTKSEFYLDTGIIDLWYCIKVYGSWFVLGFISMLIVFIGFNVLLHTFNQLVRRIRRASDNPPCGGSKEQKPKIEAWRDLQPRR